MNQQENIILAEKEKDAISEMGNIAMGAAATALSDLLNRKVLITAPSVRISTFEELQKDYPIPCVITTIDYTKGLQGTSVLIIKEEDALLIAKVIMENSLGQVDIEEMDEMAVSTIGEAMNQMVGASSTSLSKFLEMDIDISPPKVDTTDLKESREGVAKVNESEDNIVCTSFKLNIEDLVDSFIVQISPIAFTKQIANLMLKTIDPLDSVEEEKEGASFVNEENLSIKPDLATEKPIGTDGGPKTTNNSDENLDNIDLIKNLPLDIKVLLGSGYKQLSEVISMGKGSIVELDRKENELVDIMVNGQLIAKGEVVVVNGQFGVRIVDIVNPRTRIMSFEGK